MLLPVALVSVVTGVALVNCIALYVQLACSDMRLGCFACTYNPSSDEPLIVQCCEGAVILTPYNVAAFRLHPQEVDGVAVRHRHHLNPVEVFEECNAIRTIAEVNVPVDAYDSVLEFVGDQGVLVVSQSLQIVSIQTWCFFQLPIKDQGFGGLKLLSLLFELEN